MAHQTIGEAYGPAMAITDQAEADAYLEELVKQTMEYRAHLNEEPAACREEALRIERANLAYYAGYYDNETRERVERLFGCAHPIFGSIKQNGAPTAREAFDKGKESGETDA